jgi:hypothetical protein
VLDTTATPPETPADRPDRVSRVWRIVLIVVAVQAGLVLLGTVAFSALGLADQPTGCGGG